MKVDVSKHGHIVMRRKTKRRTKRLFRLRLGFALFGFFDDSLLQFARHFRVMIELLGVQAAAARSRNGGCWNTCKARAPELPRG